MKKQEELDLDAYPFTVRKLTAEEGGGYLVEYPDVPLCQSDGETIEEAIANSRDALEGSLMCYLQDNKPLPKPSSGQAYSGTFRVRMSKTMHAQIAARGEGGRRKPEPVRGGGHGRSGRQVRKSRQD